MRSFGAVLLLLTSFAYAQQYVESVEVRLHNLDAVVTDRDGKPVTGLTKDDFVIVENGVPQDITNFSSYESSASTMSIPEEGAPEARTTPSLAAPPPPRRFVFFIDEMAIQSAARETLKKNALTLVRGMRSGDLAAVIRPGGAAKMAQEYTGDAVAAERALSKAIDECKVRLTAPAFRELQAFRRALETADSRNEMDHAKRTYRDAARARVEQRLSQIRALITSMASNPGKKVLVLITSGLSSQPGLEVYTTEEQMGLFEAPRNQVEIPVVSEDDLATMPALARLKLDLAEDMRKGGTSGWQGMESVRTGDFRPEIDNLARTAAAEGITIYALEPEVPLMLDATKGADSRTLGSTLLSSNSHVTGQKVVPEEFLEQLLRHEAQTLTSFAEKTGGRWFRGPSQIDDTFQQMTSDLQAYYSLAYRAKGEDAKPRQVKVTVKNRPELVVRTRTEVIDRSAARDMSERVLANLLYQDEVNELKMTARADAPKKKGRAYDVPVEIVIPVEKIAFVRGSGGKYQARVSVHYATAREEREFFSYGKQEQLIELTDQQYAELRKIRYRYTSTITVPRGHIRIALGVIDATSKQTSLSTLSVVAQ